MVSAGFEPECEVFERGTDGVEARPLAAARDGTEVAHQPAMVEGWIADYRVPPVDDAGDAIGVDEDVLRAEVAMDEDAARGWRGR